MSQLEDSSVSLTTGTGTSLDAKTYLLGSPVDRDTGTEIWVCNRIRTTVCNYGPRSQDIKQDIKHHLCRYCRPSWFDLPQEIHPMSFCVVVRERESVWIRGQTTFWKSVFEGKDVEGFEPVWVHQGHPTWQTTTVVFDKPSPCMSNPGNIAQEFGGLL